MAGTLPGVGVGSRRMSHHRHRQDDPLVFREPPPLRERLQHSTTVTMGETALMARQRLDRKLAHYRASSRSSKQGANGSRESNHKERTKRNSSIGSKILGRPWKLQLNTGSKSNGEMCSVCLEDFEGEQQMMELSCSHKYHSNCLMPWLASHPHCPTCRNPVQCA
ncbi:hypothetical protein AAG906_024806 [Vitis piasezkii]|uniref:RING-type domain-containing protein n=2 Tax=Vitis vinifera TaxID=29760 RepID=A0ABY9BWD0_VITVI|nr:RING-H2 finger protein ATL33 [Vitis vinifera]WJZ87151.1 hypothetical protein VitviT2T_006553 [Vitis vinifera]|eukprot:XP_002283255.1 PREDICTED: RING-H2 finger protein ATL33 [Vitis vinifera]